MMKAALMMMMLVPSYVSSFSCVPNKVVPWCKYRTRNNHHHHHRNHNDVLAYSRWYCPTKTTAIFLSKGNSNNENNKATTIKDYNDDAFGFVFLGSLALTQDVVFATVFVLFSAIAAIVTRQQQRRPNDNCSDASSSTTTKTTVVLLPAIVAGSTLVLTVILRQVVPDQYDAILENILAASSRSTVSMEESSSAATGLWNDPTWIQAGLCTVSIVYGILQASRNNYK
jgi:hypothetical protein